MALSCARKSRTTPRLEVLEARDVPAGFLTAVPSYLTATAPAVQFTPLVTANDVVNGYRMVGIPDGMGAYDNNDGTFTILLNHELGATSGAARAHGGTGAFVSKWVVSKSDLSVLSGADLIDTVYLYDRTTGQYTQTTGVRFNRFCSADLPVEGAFYNPASGLGTTERIFLNGEESGAEGRAFATVVSTGDAYELPYLGRFSWENSVASPLAQDKTIVVGLDDSGGGQVYIYVGNKTSTGNVIDRAGLSGGTLYGLAVEGVTSESSTGDIGATSKAFTLASLGDASRLTGAQLESNSNAAGVTQFLRPEDGHWDPNNPNDFYWVTTNSFGASTRLWRLRFNDITKPEQGGTIEELIDSRKVGAGEMFDNITVDNYGHVLIQEDPGGNNRLSRIYQYDIATGDLVEVAQHTPAYFQPGGANFLTNNEESSGIIDLSPILGPGYFAVNVQAHFGISGEVVEGGQLLIMNTNAATAAVIDGVLTVQGTINDDLILVSQSGASFSVYNGSTLLGTFPTAGIKSLRVEGSAGSDIIMAKAVFVDSLLIGGLGDDIIFAGFGRNVLVGGAGSDALYGSRGTNNLLIGGTVTDGSALDAAFAAWTGAGSFADRAAAVNALLAGKVTDHEADYLFGFSPFSLFFKSDGDFAV